MRKQSRSNPADAIARARSAPPDLPTPITVTEGEPGQEADKSTLQGTLEEVDHDLRRRMISEAAYKLYAERGYRDGYELDDWLEAEAEVDRALANQRMGGLPRA